MGDQDVARAMTLCGKLRITVHIRGTDAHPVVEFKHKRSRRVIGGIELRKMMEKLDNGV